MSRATGRITNDRTVVSFNCGKPRRRGVARPVAACALAATACALALTMDGQRSALAGPDGANVLKGAVGINQVGNSWFITASNGAVIQYNSFNISPAELVQFLQPGSNSAVLNLIPFSGSPTNINGSLLANGIVYIVNPNGVMFGNNAYVNVGGIYAAAAAIGADQSAVDNFATDWNTAILSGNPAQQQFTWTLTGPVDVLAGAQLHGASAVHLLGQRITHAGAISVDPGGMIALIAHNGEVTLTKPNGHFLINVATGFGADNGNIAGIGIDGAGSLSAGGGQVVLGASDVYSLAVKLGGAVSAQNVTVASGAGVDQTGGAIGADELLLLGDGDFHLIQSGNNVNTLAADMTGILRYTDAGAVHIGEANGTAGLTASNVLLTAGGPITQSEAITTGILVARTLNDAGAAITLDHAGNAADIINLTVRNAADTADAFADIAYVDSGGFLITGISTLGNVSLTAGGDVTQLINPFGAINAAALELLDHLGGASFTLTNSSNNVGTLAGNVSGNIAYTDAAGIHVGAVNGTDGLLAANVTLTAHDAITQSEAITTGALLATTLKDGGAAVTLDHAANSAGSIDLQALNAAGDAAAAGDITYVDSGGFTVAGITTASHANLTAHGAIDQSGAINAGSLAVKTLNDGGASITLNNAANSVGSVALQSLNAAGDATASGDIVYRGLGGFDVQKIATTGNVTLHAGGLVTQSGAIDATGLELLGAGSYSLTHADNDIVTLSADIGGFLDYLDANTFAVGIVNGTVGIVAGGFVTLEGGGATIVLDQSIITNGAQITLNDHVILGDLALILLDTTNGGGAAGANIVINGTINDNATSSALKLTAGTGDVTLGGAVGNANTIASLDVQGAAINLNGGLVNTQGDQTYTGGVTLGGPASTVLESTNAGDITIAGALAGNGRNLAVNTGGEASFSTVTGVGALTTNAGGTTVFNGQISAGSLDVGNALTLNYGGGSAASPSILTTGAQIYRDTVTLNADTFIEAGAPIGSVAVDFHKSINSSGVNDLTVTTTNGGIRFGESIGNTGALGSLDLKVGKTAVDNHANVMGGSIIEFGAPGIGNPIVVTANGVFLNNYTNGGGQQVYHDGMGNFLHTPLAQIGSHGDLTFNTSMFKMGLGQKMTVFGHLTINALGGQAFLGDLNTLGNMNVTAGAINLLLRPSAGLHEIGTDYIAGGVFNFNGPIFKIGAGGPPLFANPTGIAPVGQVGLIFSPLPDHFRPIAGPNAGRFLDVAAQGTSIEDLSDAISAEIPRAEAANQTAPPMEIGAEQREALARLLPVRDMDEGELLVSVGGRRIYIDSEYDEDDNPVKGGIVINRLGRTEAIHILQLLELLRGEADLPALFSTAWNAYMTDAGADAPTERHAAWLAEVVANGREVDGLPRESAERALERLLTFMDLIDWLEAMGLVRKEVNVSEITKHIYEEFHPTGLSPEEFREVIQSARGLGA